MHGKNLSAKCKKVAGRLSHSDTDTDLSNEFLMQILLYGDNDFLDSLNKDILLLTLRFIHEIGRFD